MEIIIPILLLENLLDIQYSTVNNVLKLINVFVSQYEEMQERVRLESERIKTYHQRVDTSPETSNIYYDGDQFSIFR
jgi:hypothetical protein